MGNSTQNCELDTGAHEDEIPLRSPSPEKPKLAYQRRAEKTMRAETQRVAGETLRNNEAGITHSTRRRLKTGGRDLCSYPTPLLSPPYADQAIAGVKLRLGKSPKGSPL